MLRRILVGLVLLAALVFAIGLVLPDKVHVERSASIQAPASQVFALLDGFRQFDKWSPWAERDAQMKKIISGPLFGIGSRYDWAGSEAVGKGSQVVVDSRPYQSVTTRVLFEGAPQPAIAEFALKGGAQGTQVTWSMDVPLGGSPIAHYFGPMVKKQIEPDFERGLAKLKSVAEAGPKTDFSALTPILTQVNAQALAYVSVSTSTDQAVIAKAMTEALGKVGEYMKNGKLKQMGAQIAITRRWDDQAKVYQFDAGFPIDRTDVEAPAGSEVKVDLTYAGQVLKVEHRGPYKDIPAVYAQLAAFEAAYGLQDNGASWEQYVSDPAHTAEADLVVDIYVPIK